MPAKAVSRFIGRFAASLLLVITLGQASFARDVTLSTGSVSITKEVSGLQGAWAFGFLSGGELIISEKRGRLYLAEPGESPKRIRGLPDIHVEGQGGLLDVVPAKDFATTGEIFLTYVGKQSEGVGTTAAVATLNMDSLRLENLRVIYQMTPGSFGGRHFGSRIAEADDGSLYITIGDRGDRESAQDLDRSSGSTARVLRDGTVPRNNPFTDRKAPETWSYGHRNPQGLAISGAGDIWAVEHGARGGDEVNLIQRGANYGWPVISFGTHYSGAKIGEGTQKAGMEQPEFFWDPSIAPSGMMIYDGDMFPEWKGDIFIGSLKFDYISRLSGSPLREVEQIELSETKRVRDVRQGPDGSIWFISEDRGGIYKISR